LEVDPGPAVKFGRLTLEGLEQVDQEYVERVLEWPEGELWDRRLLEDRRERLLDMDLF
nr:hypothetical protein [Desulfuromonadales bacterium]